MTNSATAATAATPKVLCNCDVLCEGFDLPKVEAVLLLRNTMSKRLYIQQVVVEVGGGIGKGVVVVVLEALHPTDAFVILGLASPLTHSRVRTAICYKTQSR